MAKTKKDIPWYKTWRIGVFSFILIIVIAIVILSVLSVIYKWGKESNDPSAKTMHTSVFSDSSCTIKLKDIDILSTSCNMYTFNGDNSYYSLGVSYSDPNCTQLKVNSNTLQFEADISASVIQEGMCIHTDTMYGGNYIKTYLS